jgi:hypothetical protein
MRLTTVTACLSLLLVSPHLVSATPLPITINQNVGLAFGRFASGNGAGTVTVPPLGTRFFSGAVALVGNSAYSAAWFTVTGEPNTVYTIVLPGAVSLSSGGNSMSVGSFESSPGGTGLLGTSGSQALYFGATLSIGAHQPMGNYTGSFDVTVVYN